MIFYLTLISCLLKNEIFSDHARLVVRLRPADVAILTKQEQHQNVKPLNKVVNFTAALLLLSNTQTHLNECRKKKAPPKLVELEEETSRSARKKSIQKPRYHLEY